jgi:hypothetical protein
VVVASRGAGARSSTEVEVPIENGTSVVRGDGSGSFVR